MADERVKITVSYAGREKRIPLVVSPSLELSDVQVEYAESDLHRVVRHVFQVPYESLFYLHEAESGRIMSRETFREPTQLSAFPRHWYLTVDNYCEGRAVVDVDEEEKPKMNGPVDYPDLLPLADGRFTPREEEEEEQEDEEEDEVRSLAGLSPSDTKYQTVTVRCNEQGHFGFTLRHFSIQPSNIPRFDTPTDPSSHSDSRTSTPSRRDSLDTLKLSSTFVRHVVPGGMAEEAGLGEGDVVQMVNGVSIIRSGWEETRELLQQCGDELALLVLPKENDDLQFLYPQYAYGSTGDYTTSEGQVFACDLTVAVGNGSSELKGNAVTVVPHGRSNTSQKLQGNHLVVERPESVRTSSGAVPKLDARLPNGRLSVNSPPIGLIPFNDTVGSAASLDNSNSLSCSNENMVGQPSSTDDILISGSLSEIPVALVDSPSDKHRFDTNWGVQKKSNGPHQLNGNGEFSEFSPTWQNHYTSGIQNGEIHSTAGVHHSGEFEYAHRELNFISEDPIQGGMEWYRDTDDGTFLEFSLGQNNSISEEIQSGASDPNFLGMNKPRRKSSRTTSQSSLERRHSALHRVSSHPLTARAALTSSMSALDRMPFPRSQGSEHSQGRNKSKSTELGNIRLKRRGKKSLEGLTRIGSDENLRRESERQRLKRHKSDENTHRIVRLSAPETSLPDAWTERSTAPVSTPTRGITGMSDYDSQLSDSLPPPQAQLSGQSEEQKMSGESGSTTRSASEISGSGIPFRGRRSVKSYQSQRAQLHKSRARTESEVGVATTTVGERPRLKRRPSNSGDHSESTEPRRVSRKGRGRSSTSSPPAEEQLQREQPPLSKQEQPPVSKLPLGKQDLLPEVKEVQQEEIEPLRTEKPRKMVPTPPAIRKLTVIEPQREEGKSVEPVRREHRVPRERPMSATESSPQLRRQAASLEYRYGATLSPSMTTRDHRQSLEIPSANNRHKLTRSVEVPMSSEYGRRIPIYHTHSAQTPYGEQIVTDISIDDAIRLYRGLSPTRKFSVDSGVEASTSSSQEGYRRPLYEKQRGISEEKLYPLTRSSRERGRSTEVLATSPSSPTNMAISGMCNGVLSKKQDRAVSGKRSHDRSWKTYYAVLIASKIVFYKDRRDAIMSKPCDEPPIVVVPSFTLVDHNYTKKKFVFRVATPHGPEYLLQASDAESMQRWVSTLQALNKDRAFSMEFKPKEVVESKPYSPIFGRKLASPQPSKPKKKKEEGGGGTRLLDKLKRTLTRRENDEPDFSSYVTFGQPLEDCPVSHENKRVPLVVEYCVNEVEKHGLEAEGIYRISGATTLVKDLSTEMDKGNYNFTDYGGIHTIAGLLKKFFKELPDSLIPAAVHDDFIATAQEQDEEQRLMHLRDLVYHLPTAHYHTLKYLIAHLNKIISHSDQNKMTLKNLRIVFGPTLVRTPSDDFSTINDGYTVIELLCKHMEFLFGSELCAEEQEWAERLEVMQKEEEEEEALASPSARRREPREVETKMQKDQALEKASPMTLRRIKNDFTTVKGVGAVKSSSSDNKRNSFIQIEGTIPLQPKQHNWEGSAQLLPQYRSDTLKSNRSSSPGHRSPEAAAPQQQVSLGGSIPYRNPKHHVQQQQQQQQLPQQHHQQQHSSAEGSDSVSRTRHWVNHHREMGWGKDGERDESRELRGSMWASRNREQPQRQHVQPRDKKEKRRLTKPRQQLVTSYPSPVEPAHEFLASFSGSSSFRTSSLPSSDIHDTGGNHVTHSYQATKHSTLPLPSSPTTRRRISYVRSMADKYLEDDTPTRDDRRGSLGSGSLDQHYRQHRHPHHNQHSSGYQSHHQYSTHRQRLVRHSSSDSYVDSSPPSDQSLKDLHSLSMYSHLKRAGRVSPRHQSFEESPPEPGSRLVHSPYSTAAQVESYL